MTIWDWGLKIVEVLECYSITARPGATDPEDFISAGTVQARGSTKQAFQIRSGPGFQSDRVLE